MLALLRVSQPHSGGVWASSLRFVETTAGFADAEGCCQKGFRIGIDALVVGNRDSCAAHVFQMSLCTLSLFVVYVCRAFAFLNVCK